MTDTDSAKPDVTDKRAANPAGVIVALGALGPLLVLLFFQSSPDKDLPPDQGPLAMAVVNEHPNLPRAEFDHLKAVLHRCVIEGPQAQNRSGIADWRGHLIGRVSWAQQINPVKGARLSALLARIDWTR